MSQGVHAATATGGGGARRHKLSVTDMSLRFGGIVALDGLSFNVDEGTICGLIGPNGAGKTSCFNCISRLYSPSSGQVTFDGKDISGVRSKDVVTLGIARTFQNLALLPALTHSWAPQPAWVIGHRLRLGIMRRMLSTTGSALRPISDLKPLAEPKKYCGPQ